MTTVDLFCERLRFPRSPVDLPTRSVDLESNVPAGCCLFFPFLLEQSRPVPETCLGSADFALFLSFNSHPSDLPP